MKHESNPVFTTASADRPACGRPACDRTASEHGGSDPAADPSRREPADAGQSEHVHGAHVERYSLATALSLIVGISIGSGIFFKSDNILVATGGNVALGVAMFLLAATTIVFGGLTLARFASQTAGAGGPIAYAERFLGPKRLTFIGWNFTFIYLPIVTGVICWVVGVYACMAFGLPGDFRLQMAIGVAFLLACFAWNVCWPSLGGWFANATTVFKVLPLIAVGVIGVLFADPGSSLVQGIEQAPAAGAGWVIAAAPVAFAFDGWTAAAGIAPEIKNSKRNLPIALIAGPIIILALYIAYFVGISCFLGPQEVMAAGDASLSLLFVKLFGPQAAAWPNLIAFIAVAGTANGLILSILRMPYALAVTGEVPFAKSLLKMNRTLRFPLVSAFVALGSVLFWMGVHAFVTVLGLLPNGDISEIAVSLNLFIMPLFYVQAILHDPAGPAPARASRIRRAIVPALATVSSLAVGISSFADPSRWPFVAVLVGILAAITIAMRQRGPAR